MKKKRIIVSGILVAVCSVFFLTSCKTKEADKVTITLIHGWGSTEADHIAMRKIYEDFERENPEITLNLISMPSSEDVISKVEDLLTVGEIPDIIFTGGDGRESVYNFMVEKEYALNLMPYIEKDNELKDNISPSILSYWTTEEGQLYTASDVLLMGGGYWYNRDIFEQAGIEEIPKDWEQWIETCRKIKEYGEREEIKIEPILLDSDQIIYLTDAILSDEDPSMLSDLSNHKVNLYSLGFRRTIEKLEEFSEYVQVVNSFNYRDTLVSFNQKETAMYINGVWASSMISPKLNVAYAAFPTENGDGVCAVSSCVGYILGDTKDNGRMDASVKFIKYMLSQPVAKRILEETGQVPSNPHIVISEGACKERLFQSVSCVQGTSRIIETPANIWGKAKKEDYGDNLILYLENKISYAELQERLGQ